MQVWTTYEGETGGPFTKGNYDSCLTDKEVVTHGSKKKVGQVHY